MTSYLKSLLGYKNENISLNSENDQSINYEIKKTVSEKDYIKDKRLIEALDLSYFSEKQKNLNLDLNLSFGHLKGKNDLDFKLAFGHLVTPNDLISEKDFVFKKSKEVEEERKNKKNKDGKELLEEEDKILLKNPLSSKIQYPDFDNYDWKNSTIV